VRLVRRRLLRRAAHGLLLLAAVSLFTFALSEWAPGDFYAEMRLDPRLGDETLRALRVRHGLDRPLPERYVLWLGSALRGELGFSFAYGQPVAPLVWPRARNTLLLAGTATALSWLIALPLGTWWARSRAGDLSSKALGGATALLLAVPDVVAALALMLLALRTGWFPIGGMQSLGHEALAAPARAADVVAHLVLPALALALGALPTLLRHVRVAMAAALAEPFVLAARAHGIPERRVLLRHALPAAANPLVSLFGLSVASLLSMSLLVEAVMGWPGLGPLLVEAILARDFHVVLASVLASTVFLLAGNLAADLLLAAVDPRIRTEEA
jgi:peptide/nickel transport system permease protein